MEKLANWLQVIGNIAIVGGLIMVAVQLNQNAQLATADLQSRAFQLAMQFNIARMGENPNETFAKAATNPSELTDEELLTLYSAAWFWVNYDSHDASMMEFGLIADDESQREVWRARVHDVWKSNEVFSALWRRLRDTQSYSELQERGTWAEIMDAEFRSTPLSKGDAELLSYLRTEVAANSPEPTTD